MNKPWIFYAIFLFSISFNVSVANREIPEHCRAETPEQQNVVNQTADKNTEGIKGSASAQKAVGAQDATDAQKAIGAPDATNAQKAIGAQDATNEQNAANKESSPDTTQKWNSLQPGEYDVLPQKRGLTAPHYPASNENRIDLFYDSIKNLGGGYVGVGTDQNFTFIAWARSEYAYLMDFDPVVVNINRIHLHFIDISKDYAAFRTLWTMKNKHASLKIIRDRFQKEPDYSSIVKAYYIATGTNAWSPVPERLRSLERLARRNILKTFVNQPADYEYIRSLVQKGRILAVPGNLNGSKTFTCINTAARSLDIPIRVLYTSNAEDYFRSYTKEFRKNIIDIPADEKGVLIRTCSVGARRMGFPEGELIPAKPYHYNVQSLKSMQEWMKIDSIRRITDILLKRTAVSRGLSVVKDLPDIRNDAISKGTPAK